MPDTDPMAGMNGGVSGPNGGATVTISDADVKPDASAQQPESTSQTNEPSPTDGTGDGAGASATDGKTKGTFEERIRGIVGKDITGLRESLPQIVAQALREAGIAPREAAAAAAQPGMGGELGKKFASDVQAFGVEVAMENYNKAVTAGFETRLDTMQAKAWLHAQPEAKESDFEDKWRRFAFQAEQRYPFLRELARTSPGQAAELGMQLYRAENKAAEPVKAASATANGNPSGIPKEAVTSPGGSGGQQAGGAAWTPAVFMERMTAAQGIQDPHARREQMNKISQEYDTAKATGRWKES